MRTFDPGAFSARLDLLEPVLVSDGQGGATESFSKIAELWARIEPVSISFTEEANGAVFRLTHKVWMRRRDDLAPGMRFGRRGRIFKINGWRDPDETGRYLVCSCEEVDP